MHLHTCCTCILLCGSLELPPSKCISEEIYVQRSDLFKVTELEASGYGRERATSIYLSGNPGLATYSSFAQTNSF